MEKDVIVALIGSATAILTVILARSKRTNAPKEGSASEPVEQHAQSVGNVNSGRDTIISGRDTIYTTGGSGQGFFNEESLRILEDILAEKRLGFGTRAKYSQWLRFDAELVDSIVQHSHRGATSIDYSKVQDFVSLENTQLIYASYYIYLALANRLEDIGETRELAKTTSLLAFLKRAKELAEELLPEGGAISAIEALCELQGVTAYEFTRSEAMQFATEKEMNDGFDELLLAGASGDNGVTMTIVQNTSDEDDLAILIMDSGHEFLGYLVSAFFNKTTLIDPVEARLAASEEDPKWFGIEIEDWESNIASAPLFRVFKLMGLLASNSD